MVSVSDNITRGDKMFCPRCGLQLPVNLRFCSRCGLRLDGVALLLANDGAPAQPDQTPGHDGAPSNRKRMRQGAKLMFLSGVVTPLFFGLCVLSDSPAPLILSFTIFLAGLAWMLYFRLFGDSTPETQAQTTFNSGGTIYPKAIPAPQTREVIRTTPGSIRTGSLEQGPSVTEGTTELFEKQ
jgi:hypothetical protein